MTHMVWKLDPWIVMCPGVKVVLFSGGGGGGGVVGGITISGR